MGRQKIRGDEVLAAGMPHPRPEFQILGQGRRRDLSLDRTAGPERVPREFRAALGVVIHMAAERVGV